MAITSGDAPSADIDLSFIEDLGLKGYVASSDRGSVSGTYSGTADGLDVTIGFKVWCNDGLIECLAQTSFRTMTRNTGSLVLGE